MVRLAPQMRPSITKWATWIACGDGSRPGFVQDTCPSRTLQKDSVSRSHVVSEFFADLLRKLPRREPQFMFALRTPIGPHLPIRSNRI
jgi:hypothetical protein